MTKGIIKVTRMDLRENEGPRAMYVVTNAGGTETYNFLKQHAKCFWNTSDGYAIEEYRIEKFKEYALEKGFEVVVKKWLR